MEESGLLEYWFVWVICAFFFLWFPSYILRSRGIPNWKLAFCIVAVFLLLPLLAISFYRDIIPTILLGGTLPLHTAPNAVLSVRTDLGAARLDQLYVALASIIVAIGIGQALFSAWLLYVRHNRESLLRAIRIMWCSALMQVLAVCVLPMMFLQQYGLSIVKESALAIGGYILILFVVTLYLRTSRGVARFYPISHKKN